MSKAIAIPLEPGDELVAAVERFLARVRKADQPLALVRELGSHDLLIALREADAEQAVELLTLADRAQIWGVTDLACWPTDRPNLDALEELIEPLVASGLDGASKALDDLPDELRVLMLMRYVIVHLQEEDDDEVPAADGSELISCPDGTYFIELPNPDDVPDVIRSLLAALLSRPFELYQPELECLRHELPSELQEEGLRWRNARLADLGFGTREEGIELLTPRAPRDVRRALDAAGSVPHPLELDVSPPAIYRANLEGRALLDRSIAELARAEDPVYRQRAELLGAELTGMTSLFLTGVGCDLGSIEAVARGARWARDLINLGLEALVGDDPAEGARALAYLVPGTLLQTAMGLLSPLRQRARKVLADPRLAPRGARGALLDAPHRIAVDCSSRSIPLNWPPLIDGRDLTPNLPDPLPEELEAYAGIEDLDRARKLLDEAEQLPGLLFDRLGWRIIPAAETATASVLVLAALARAAVGERPRPEPLTAEAATEFVDRVLSTSEEQVCADALAVLAPAAGLDPTGPLQPLDEPDPLRRLLLRLILLGRARLGADDPLHVLPLS